MRDIYSVIDTVRLSAKATLLQATHAPLYGLEPTREFTLDSGMLTEVTGENR